MRRRATSPRIRVEQTSGASWIVIDAFDGEHTIRAIYLADPPGWGLARALGRALELDRAARARSRSTTPPPIQVARELVKRARARKRGAS